MRRAVLGAWLATGCASSDEDAGSYGFPPRDYIFAGQTGSLVPNCGVAPLSQEHLAVPVGDALAVLYTSGCPEVGTAGLSVVGPDARGVPVRLEPLDASGVYLVRVDESLSEGDYELELPERPSTSLSVADAPASLPVSLGTISALPQSSPCGSDVTFEWALDPDALAHAPLLRLWIRVDGSTEQLWVDYGALQVDEETGLAQLRLPRCGPASCLLDGRHEVQMRAEVAGESADPEPLGASFDLLCPDSMTTSGPSSGASASASASEGCSLGAMERSTPPVFILSGAVLVFRRWARRRVVALPGSERSP